MKKKITATVLSQKEIAPRIFDMWIATELAACAKAGQFIGVYPKDRSTLLPRPISICQVSDKKDALRIVYRIAGQGTAEFSSYQEGDSVEILGTLGNGFPTEAAEGKRYSSWAVASASLPCWSWPESFRHPQKSRSSWVIVMTSCS